jgi:hypothetical protein
LRFEIEQQLLAQVLGQIRCRIVVPGGPDDLCTTLNERFADQTPKRSTRTNDEELPATELHV